MIRPPGGLAGSAATCFVLTMMTVLTAAFAGQPQIDMLLRPLYFALLFSFFYAIGRRQQELRILPFRLIEVGFLVLTVGLAAAAVLRSSDLLGLNAAIDAVLLTSLEHGAVFLLGLSSISFGIILWIPQLLESQHILRARYDQTRGRLRHSEQVRSRMEHRFAQADRLHALGELAAGIAHDLRNPLAIIKGAAGSMTRGHRNQQELAEHVEVICRNIDRAERTIAALLDLGKPPSYVPRPVLLADAVADVAALVDVEARRSGVRLERRIDPTACAAADSKLLGQALLNLVLNALHASPPGTAVVLRAHRVRLGGVRWVVCAVEDAGEGIAPEARGKLFTPFFTTKEQGCGLGLLATRRVVGEMGGAVALYPRTHGGARAVLMLPSHQDLVPQAAAASEGSKRPCQPLTR